MNDEEVLRMQYLEDKAKKEFIMNCDWSAIMEMLSAEEKLELEALYDLLDKAQEEKLNET